jgi:hypothetical protein
MYDNSLNVFDAFIILNYSVNYEWKFPTDAPNISFIILTPPYMFRALIGPSSGVW